MSSRKKLPHQYPDLSLKLTVMSKLTFPTRIPHSSSRSLPYIGQRIISDLKEFRMLPGIFSTFLVVVFSDAYTLLSVISWVGKALVIVEFHGFFLSTYCTIKYNTYNT